jgi:hypothetical protein
VVNLRLTIVSQIGGWWQTAYNDPLLMPATTLPNISIVVTDPDKGAITIATSGGVLNMLDGYQYTVQMKQPTDNDAAYKTVARGFIELFNR